MLRLDARDVVAVSWGERSGLERVSLSRAARWKKKPAYYRTTRGQLVAVVKVCPRACGPNCRLSLEDGREFLVDPRTMLYAGG